MEEIERTRPTKGFGIKKILENPNEVSETDLKKISLIRSYVITNTKEDMLEFLIPNYIKEGKSQLVVGIGCTGGKHRSVAIAEEITKRLNENGHKAKVEHRDSPKW